MENDQTVFSFQLVDKELVANVDVGEVLEIQSHSETRVSGAGGGGRISTDGRGDVSGNITPVEISAKVVNKTKIWVKTDNAAEDEWIFPVDITALSVRIGHKIGRYTLVDSATRQGTVRTFVNFTTGRTLSISSDEYSLNSLGLLRETEGFGSCVAIGAGLGLFLGFILGNAVSGGLGFIVFLFGLAGGFMKAKDKKVTNIAFNADCAKQLQEVDSKVMELLASNQIPSFYAYVQSQKKEND